MAINVRLAFKTTLRERERERVCVCERERVSVCVRERNQRDCVLGFRNSHFWKKGPDHHSIIAGVVVGIELGLPVTQTTAD